MLIGNVITAVKNCLPKSNEAYQLHEPFFDLEEEKNVLHCIQTKWVSYQGDFVKEFEAELEKRCEVKHAIAVSNGTIALFLALKIAGIQPNDEVLIPSLTFIATANAVHHAGAIAHFVEADYRSFGIDIEKLEEYLNQISLINNDGTLINKQSGRIIRCIIPVHVFGHPVDLIPLTKVAKKFNLLVIEDGAESLGSAYNAKAVGSFGDLAILSFNGNKIVTTGGGGAIITNDTAMAEKIKHVSTTAKVAHPYEFIHDQIGYNFRMPNLNAAVGVAQLRKLDSFVHKKRNLATKYQLQFQNNEFADFFIEPSYAQSNYWLNSIILNKKYEDQKNELLQAFHQQNIKCRPFWRPIHMLNMYKNNPRCNSLEVTEDLYKRTICLPSSPILYE